MKVRAVSLLLSLSLVAASALAELNLTPSPEGAAVYFISPADGATVPTTFVIRFGLKGMGVAPAGTRKENTGHHHLLIDGRKMPELDQPLTQELKHYGGGQTETELTLTPGKHTLKLFLADDKHVPHDPPVISDTITINVVK